MSKYQIKLKYNIKSEYNIPINQFGYQYEPIYEQRMSNTRKFAEHIEREVAASISKTELAEMLQSDLSCFKIRNECCDGKLILILATIDTDNCAAAGLLNEYLTNTAMLFTMNCDVAWIDGDTPDNECKTATQHLIARLADVEISVF